MYMNAAHDTGMLKRHLVAVSGEWLLAKALLGIAASKARASAILVNFTIFSPRFEEHGITSHRLRRC